MLYYKSLLVLLFSVYYAECFVKTPFQCNFRNMNFNNTLGLNKIKYVFKSLCVHKNSREIRNPAILEIPMGYNENWDEKFHESWDEGEIPWDFVGDNATITNNISNIMKNFRYIYSLYVENIEFDIDKIAYVYLI